MTMKVKITTVEEVEVNTTSFRANHPFYWMITPTQTVQLYFGSISQEINVKNYVPEMAFDADSYEIQPEQFYVELSKLMHDIKEKTGLEQFILQVNDADLLREATADYLDGREHDED